MTEQKQKLQESGRALGYARVSTRRQADRENSIKTQKKYIRDWADARELKNVIIFKDKGRTGRRMQGREQLAALLEEIKEYDWIVVYSISRLSRSISDLQQIIKTILSKKAYFSAKELTITKAGESSANFLFNIMGSVSVYESEIISERVRDGMRTKKEDGESVGRPPFGKRKCKKIGPGGSKYSFVDDEEEQKTISYIRTLCEGKKDISNYELAGLMNKTSFRCRKSAAWYPATIGKIRTRYGFPSKYNHKKNILGGTSSFDEKELWEKIRGIAKKEEEDSSESEDDSDSKSNDKKKIKKKSKKKSKKKDESDSDSDDEKAIKKKSKKEDDSDSDSDSDKKSKKKSKKEDDSDSDSDREKKSKKKSKKEDDSDSDFDSDDEKVIKKKLKNEDDLDSDNEKKSKKKPIKKDYELESESDTDNEKVVEKKSRKKIINDDSEKKIESKRKNEDAGDPIEKKA